MKALKNLSGSALASASVALWLFLQIEMQMKNQKKTKKNKKTFFLSRNQECQPGSQGDMAAFLDINNGQKQPTANRCAVLDKGEEKTKKTSQLKQLTLASKKPNEMMELNRFVISFRLCLHVAGMPCCTPAAPHVKITTFSYSQKDCLSIYCLFISSAGRGGACSSCSCFFPELACRFISPTTVGHLSQHLIHFTLLSIQAVQPDVFALYLPFNFTP